MRAVTRSRLLLSLALVSSAIACSHTRTVTMNAQRPAEVSVPSAIRALLIVDRTGAASAELGFLEGVMTGELPGQDRTAVQAGIRALRGRLDSSGRFELQVASERLEGNSLTLALPDPLPPSRIRQLSRKYGVDGVLAVELFDSDLVVTGAGKRDAPTSEDGRRPVGEAHAFYASGVSDLRMGFRIYDSSGGKIADEMIYPTTRTWTATGSTPQDALSRLIANANASVASGEAAAIAYATRISPSPLRIRRKFYSKSKKVPQMEYGTRLADVGSWREAATTWQDAIGIAPAEDAGKLAFNVAIAMEVLGHLDQAIEWAQRSYVEYGNDRGVAYVDQLRRRARQEDLLRTQLR